MDWGMKNRLCQIIKPDTGHTVMLAVDHGYFLGPTSGLEDPGKTIRENSENRVQRPWPDQWFRLQFPERMRSS